MMNFKNPTDYYGVEIVAGDKCLRAIYSEIVLVEVEKVTPKAVFIKRKINRWRDGKLVNEDSALRIPDYTVKASFINLKNIKNDKSN